MTQRYLVTGGSGFIGAALVRRLVEAGHAVRVFDNNSRGHPRRLSGIMDDLEFVAGDVRDAEAVSQAVRGVDGVFHFAYVNGTEYFYTHPELVLEVAVKGMVHVMDACRRHNVGTLIQASSSEVYQTPPQIPTDETVPLSVPDPRNPRNSYGGGKILCELMALHYAPNMERVMVVRPHNVYGPDMGWEHVIPQFIGRLHALQRSGAPPESAPPLPFPIQGSGQETRAFTFIDDFTDGILLLLERGEHRQIYHIGRDEEIRIDDLARAVARQMGQEITVVPGALQPGGTPRRCPDIRKMRALGFMPDTALEQGLQRTIPWYEAHPVREEEVPWQQGSPG